MRVFIVAIHSEKTHFALIYTKQKAWVRGIMVFSHGHMSFPNSLGAQRSFYLFIEQYSYQSNLTVKKITLCARVLW